MSIEAAANAEPAAAATDATQRRWRPLDRTQRRVVGVLVEKAKTTPDNYPLSINALVTGANQKSNRFPQMQLDEDQVEQALDELRHMGAVALIQGDSRVDKYRHLLYEWLGVDKAELAVMAELLLRGAQTLGELRGRAARMEPIADISELRPIVDQLRDKGLIVLLTPPGRGCVVTHNLYQPQELSKLQAEHGRYNDSGAPMSEGSVAAQPPRPDVGEAPPTAERSAPPSGMVSAAATSEPSSAVDLTELRALRKELAATKQELAQQRDQFAASIDELRRELEDLKQQLGV